MRGKNRKGVVALLFGNTISKVVATLGTLILANYYGPANYGVYTVFLSYIMIFSILVGFRLDNIMVMQRGSKEIRNLYSGILIITLITVILLTSFSFLLKSMHIFAEEISNLLLFLIGIGALFLAWNTTQNNLFTKYKLFAQISTSIVIASLFSVVFQAIFYMLSLTENGLIYGWLIGLLVSFLYNFWVSKGRLHRVDFNLFQRNLIEHKKIIQYTYPSDSINAIANNILPILVLFYFTEVEVGVYSMAFKILSLPLMLLSNSISKVYFQRAVTLNHYDKKHLYRLTKKIILFNVAIIFVFVLLLNSIGIYVLNIFLKGGWENLRIYLVPLSLWILARSAMNPIAYSVVVINKNHYSLIFNIYLLIVNFIAIYGGVLTNSFSNCIWIFSILSGLGYLVLLAAVMKNLKKNASV